MSDTSQAEREQLRPTRAAMLAEAAALLGDAEIWLMAMLVRLDAADLEPHQELIDLVEHVGSLREEMAHLAAAVEAKLKEAPNGG